MIYKDDLSKSKLENELFLSCQQIYPDDIDPEVVPLCNAMNSLPGIETTSSCCGHGKNKYMIFFKSTDIKGLFFLTRCIDRRYFEHGHNWKVVLTISDTYENGYLPVYYILESNTNGDLETCEEAIALVDNMNYHLNHKNFMKGYDLKESDFIFE